MGRLPPPLVIYFWNYRHDIMYVLNRIVTLNNSIFLSHNELLSFSEIELTHTHTSRNESDGQLLLATTYFLLYQLFDATLSQ